MQIEKVKLCEPIETLVRFLKYKGYEIVEQKVSDYHFHEVYIKMKAKNGTELPMACIDKIEKLDDHTFRCTCHWSIVEIVTE